MRWTTASTRLSNATPGGSWSGCPPMVPNSAEPPAISWDWAGLVGTGRLPVAGGGGGAAGCENVDMGAPPVSRVRRTTGLSGEAKRWAVASTNELPVLRRTVWAPWVGAVRSGVRATSGTGGGGGCEGATLIRGGATVIRRTSGAGRRPVGADAAPGGPAGKLVVGAAPLLGVAGASVQGCQVRRTGCAPRSAPPGAAARAVGPVAVRAAADIVCAAGAAGAAEVDAAPKVRTAPDGDVVRRHIRDSPPTAEAGAATGLPAGRIVWGAPNPVARVRLASLPCAVARRIVISSGMPSSAPAIPGLATWAPTRLAGCAERRTGAARVWVAAGTDPAGAEAGLGVLVGVATGAPASGALAALPMAGEVAGEVAAAGGVAAGLPVAGSRRIVGDEVAAWVVVAGVVLVRAAVAGVAVAGVAVVRAGPAGSAARRTTGAGTELRTSVAGRTSVALRHSRGRRRSSGVAPAGASTLGLLPAPDGGVSATERWPGTVACAPLAGVAWAATGESAGAVPTAEGSRRTTGSAERAAGAEPADAGAPGVMPGVTPGVTPGAVLVGPAPAVAGLAVGVLAAAGVAVRVVVVVGMDAGVDTGADAGRAAPSSPASDRAPAAWRITRLPADHACRRTVAGASMLPAIRPGPAAGTTSGLRTDDSRDPVWPGAASAGRTRPGVANLDTTLARPTDVGAAGAAPVDSVDPAAVEWP